MSHVNFRLLFFTFACVLSLSACNKGFTLRIGDQDLFAFGSQQACNFVQNSQGIRVSWKSSVPIHLIITSSVPLEFDESIIKAAQTWNSRASNLIEVHRDNSYTATPSSDGINGIYWMSDWSEDQGAEQARTSIKWEISKIQEADIKVNAKNFRFYSTGSANSAGRVNLESLMLHEFGHAVGLRHISNLTSVMQPNLGSSVDRNNPGDVDATSLNCEY